MAREMYIYIYFIYKNVWRTKEDKIKDNIFKRTHKCIRLKTTHWALYACIHVYFKDVFWFELIPRAQSDKHQMCGVARVVSSVILSSIHKLTTRCRPWRTLGTEYCETVFVLGIMSNLERHSILWHPFSSFFVSASGHWCVGRNDRPNEICCCICVYRVGHQSIQA